MSDAFRLTLDTTAASASLIALLSRHDLGPIAPLRQAITARLPIVDREPHHNQYAEFLAKFMSLLDDLDADGTKYLIEIDGETESREYVENLVESWGELISCARLSADDRRLHRFAKSFVRRERVC